MQALAEYYWREYIKVFPKLKDFDCPKIVINNRLSRVIAYNRSEENIINMGGKFMVNNLDAMKTLILPHELAHQIDYNLNGWTKGDRHHRRSWKIIMVKIDQAPELYYNLEI